MDKSVASGVNGKWLHGLKEMWTTFVTSFGVSALDENDFLCFDSLLSLTGENHWSQVYLKNKVESCKVSTVPCYSTIGTILVATLEDISKCM